MICYPNAKINIGLNIVSKRNDGFHNIESIFYPIPFYDVLEIVINDNNSKNGVEFSNTGLQIDCKTKDNICVRAWQLLKTDFNIRPVKIHLHKVIPFGAGLGGGSADGAFTLLCLNQLFSLSLSNRKLKNYALQLGSDCAFFIENKPAYVTGRGENLALYNLNLNTCYLSLINPEIHISTKDAYSGISPGKSEFSLINLDKISIIDWKIIIKNDFEESLFIKFPKIRKLKECLYQEGALYASMTGSGSILYGIFKYNPDFENKELKKTHIWTGILEEIT